jgi:hypothetical protein
VRTRKQQAGRALSSATRQLVGQFDGLLWAVYQAIDELQMRTVDLTLDVASLEAVSPRWMDATVRTAFDQCGDTLRVFGSLRGAQLAYSEVMNKIEVVELVRQPNRFLGPEGATEANLPDLIEVAYSLPPFQRIWAIEGLGHEYADWARSHGAFPQRLTAGTLAEHALPMLHAGLGLSVADHVLRGTTPYDDDADLERTVEAFRDRCAKDAQRGYAGCAFESFGLVARTLHVAAVPAIDRAIRAAAPDLRPYFWHGVGRALYFSPLEFIPGVSSPWIRAEAETHDVESHMNATAGLAWATALVNMRQPEIVSELLPHVGQTLERQHAIASGIASVFAMALETDPLNPFISVFCRYEPPDPTSKRLWAATVPSIDAVDGVRRTAKDGPGLERLFAYRPPEMEPVKEHT